MKTTGIYIHIPFCSSKCNYCDFYSMVPDEERVQSYIKELVSEIDKNSDKTKKIDTVYIGGGTPSTLPLFLLQDIANAVYKSFDCDLTEFTIECNPCSSKDIEYYKDFGVNRLSFGVQSLDDKVLKTLGRRHSAKEAIQTLERANKHYENISADLILGVCDKQKIKKDILILKSLVKHISAYLLKVEKGTPLYSQREKNLYLQPSDDETANQYEIAFKALQECELKRYEISNFAFEGYESKHNLKYWQMQDYYGFGTKAHSFINGKRYCNDEAIKEYLKGIHSGNGEQRYEETQLLFETIILGLRLDRGIDIAQINKDFDIDFLTKYEKGLKKIQPCIEIGSERMKIKPQYMLLQNSIAVEFLD